jgi:putative acetyltransferase
MSNGGSANFRRTGAALRPLLAADVPVLAAIIQASIEELTVDDYDEAQRDAWAGTAADEETLGPKLASALTLVATLDGAPVGFVALAGATHLDMLYVYPAAARTGVATLLVDAIEKLATARGAKTLDVDASDTSRPFFDARGFVAQRRETVVVGDVWIGRTHMEKSLATEK